MTELIPFLDPVLFWDVKKDELQEDKNAVYIIRRVFELGDIEEIILTHAFYGTDRCREALLTADYLREAAIVQGAAFLNIPQLSMFKSFGTKQYHAL